MNWEVHISRTELVLRKAEEKWCSGIVEQVSLDLQAAFPGIKGFSARNLWFMKQWYLFYSENSDEERKIVLLERQIEISSSILKQITSEIHEGMSPAITTS